ncbi:NAD(P)H-dependent oxidoreductase [Gracilibacillus caseinilyticus]|uniref:NAD(P)H-dependent oxidoreductase n=1 Tax=Gracilibacillus caseinilyticus TaxID=2932256 RepID=A0ABY4EYA7_9BACI|nr:NADPH-dependent FMN reductase [Gracilibacillus caseinilyticus]UOQ49388.1 NAD(P)H-dependent oxidoreductase [Gracilibacillus caseinilyticus]
MNIVAIAGSVVGSKTKSAMQYTVEILKDKYPDQEVSLLDLAEYDMQFSDGRNYLDYQGDTKFVTETIMNADVIMVGTPIFQASIPGTLKNLFDLLPTSALEGKVVSMLVTAGSQRHYLIPEQQLKPILSYMKAQVVQQYVYIEDVDFYRKEITNDDVLFRIERLVEDTMMLARTYQQMQREKDAKYDF